MLSGGSEAIERALHTGAALAQDMSVDHGGGNVLMAEQFLDGGISAPRWSAWVAKL